MVILCASASGYGGVNNGRRLYGAWTHSILYCLVQRQQAYKSQNKHCPQFTWSEICRHAHFMFCEDLVWAQSSFYILHLGTSHLGIKLHVHRIFLNGLGMYPQHHDQPSTFLHALGTNVWWPIYWSDVIICGLNVWVTYVYDSWAHNVLGWLQCLQMELFHDLNIWTGTLCK